MKRKWSGMRLKRLALHAGMATFNTILIRVFAYVPFLLLTVYAEEEGWGLSRMLGLVGWVEIALSIIILDLFDYWWHRANHRVRFLWRFHKAHHSDTYMDVTTALRFHPGELLISFFVKASWIIIWGPTVIAWFLFEAMVSLSAQFHHSNFDFPDKIERWLALIIVTPRYHASHHAVDRKFGDSNYSTIFSVWDRVFLTYSRPGSGGSTTSAPDAIGLPEGRDIAFSPVHLVTEPFSTRNLNLKNETSSG
ncbi:MAG: sterol desaturase family protein [Gammaproteobacteria bacterium]|nr:sterol desaturase family protein [Gammaproteobacteria bacterium]